MGRNCCITIERQYGSGGREVARILSERLGIPCYGRELLAVTAADNGISIEELKKLHKPFLVLVNSQRPYGEEAQHTAAQIQEKYHVTALPVNCEQLKRDDINQIMEKVL